MKIFKTHLGKNTHLFLGFFEVGWGILRGWLGGTAFPPGAGWPHRA